IDAGVRRLILGTVALESPELLSEVCRELPGRVYVALDARDGKVAVRGWTASSGVDVSEAACECERRGAAGILFTDIARDGTGGGVNVEATAVLADRVSLPVVASGGVASLGDIRRLRAVERRGVEAVIVGRALYTGAVSLRDAIAAGGRGLKADS
ncbi:MAG: HisA/HisF-related TIM barrel protein, partial [Candidatus Binatia bacterium]